MTGATGTVTYAVSTTADGHRRVATGAISTTGALAVGTYTVTGTDKDADNDTGSWGFTLTVSDGGLTQVAPFSATATPATSGAFSAQLAVTGATGTSPTP